jgi:hypothetical protein
MKKELLIASALVGSFGLAGVAEAASGSMSGHQRVGVVGTDTDSADATMAASRQSSFSVSISETTDSGIAISTGFDLAEEASTLDPQGLSLTFTSGAKLDLIEAGNSATTHVASIPSASGEQGITAGTGTNAPTTITFADGGDAVGFEFHTAADAFGVEGLKASASASFNGDAANTTTAHASSGMYSVGASYVSTAGDTTSSTSLTNTEGFVLSASAVTGNLTVGVGYADGTDMGQATSAAKVEGASTGYVIHDASVLKAGAKYVSGDITFNVGVTDGSGNDATDLTAAQSGSADSYNNTNASVSYAVAAGVTATLGYAAVENGDDGSNSQAASGDSWYVGATISF